MQPIVIPDTTKNALNALYNTLQRENVRAKQNAGTVNAIKTENARR